MAYSWYHKYPTCRKRDPSIQQIETYLQQNNNLESALKQVNCKSALNDICIFLLFFVCLAHIWFCCCFLSDAFKRNMDRLLR